MSSESTSSSAPLCKSSSDGYHLPSKASIAKLLLACTMALSHLSPTEALSSLLSYDVRFLPLSSTDQGNGINSVAFNSPYSSIRQTVTENAPSVRLNFEGVPQIPVGATLQSFSWTQNNQGDYKLPSWLTIVQSWSDNSPNFVLQLNGTDHLIANKQQDMAIVDLVGSVAYSHGPTRFIETEARAARLIVHLQLAQDLSKRPAIGQYFNRLADSEGGYKVFENKATTTVIPPFTIETGEVYNLKCGDSESNGCILGTPLTNDPNSANDINKAPYWADEYSQISIKAGTAKIVSPLALYGAIFEVAKGATVVFEGASSTTAFSLISPSNVNTFINNGNVIIRKGILRLTGTSMTGLGSITVEEGATLEIDSEQEATFGTVDTATPASTKKPIIRNKGNVVFVSGHTRVVGAIVSTGTASITIGMAAKVTLVGGTNNATTVTHVLGGLFDGKDTITSTNGLNAVGTVINGALVIDKYATALVGAGIRVQGLGSITNEYYGTLKINIDFYDPVNFPNAAIIATGPASERTSPGITNGGALVIEKGGLKLATGFSNISNGTIDISDKGYLHFTSAGAINTIKGNYLSNKGDISLTSDAKVTFSLALQSYSSIKGYTSGTAIIFSGSTNSVITRPAGKKIGTSAVPDASHLFALFTVGAVLIKDSARVRIVAPEATNGDQESPRFYAAIVQNAGYLDIDANAVFETVSYSQNFQVSTVSEPLESYSYPYVGLLGDNAALKVTTPEKYALSSTTGLIAQVDSTKITGSKLPLEIVAGAIGGVNNSLFDGTISLGANAVALPGSVFSTERVDSNHEFLDGNGNTSGDKAQRWMNILRQTRSAGRIIAKELKLVSGSTIALDLAHLGGAGIGYDQLDIAGEVSLGGGILNISTTFESLAYASSTLETFSLSARGKYSTYATATVLEDMNNRGKKSKSQAQVPKRIAKMNALSVVNQYVNGKQVFSVDSDEKSGNLDDKKADKKDDGEGISSLVEKTDPAVTSNVFENKSTAIAKIANAKEIFRLPIITSSSLKIDERFSKININWIPTDPNTAGKYTTMNVNTGKRELNKSVSSLIDQEMFTTLSKKLAQHYNTLQYSATFEGEPPLDPSLKKPIEFTEHVDPLSLNVGDLGKSKLYLAVEYNGGNVVLVGYEDGKGGSTSDATRVSSTSALMIGMATMAVAMLAMLF